MGVINVTPDSFSDGGRALEPEAALRRALELAAAGAGVLDVGGESTRPGAEPVPTQDELSRILPVLRLVGAELDVPISIDTHKPEVARAALDAGASIVNDVTALANPEMARVVAETGAGVVLMHMRGTPRTMQENPRYEDVCGEVAAELGEAVERAVTAGVEPARIVVDPGIGFGKTYEHNLKLLGQMEPLLALGHPVLVGPSRKAFLGWLLGGVPPGQRAVATAAACVTALMQGARIFRVHDVHVVRQALAVAEAVRVASLTGK